MVIENSNLKNQKYVVKSTYTPRATTTTPKTNYFMRGLPYKNKKDDKNNKL